MNNFDILFQKLKVWLRVFWRRPFVVQKELKSVEEFIDQNNIDDIFTFNIMKYLQYTPDKIFGFIPWDWQQFAYETLSKRTGDCEDIHRVLQLMFKILYKNITPYLAVALVTPSKLSHGFVVYEDNNNWFAFNYNERIGPYPTRYAAVLGVMLNKYNAQLVNWVGYYKINWELDNGQ